MINAKQELLEFLNKNNLEVLEIDCYNRDANWYLYYKKSEESPKMLNYYKSRAQYFKSINDFDFNYDSYDNDIQGFIYCVDKNTQKPCWLTRWEDDISCGWLLHKIPEYFITHKLIGYKHKYPPKYLEDQFNLYKSQIELYQAKVAEATDLMKKFIDDEFDDIMDRVY